MEHGDFRIGLEFRTAAGLWRCTDIGTRTIAAIRIDSCTLTGIADGARTERILSQAEAEKGKLVSGPPYAVAELVFDENDIEGCSLDRPDKS